MIPKTIWQTYKNNSFGSQASQCVTSWKEINTNFKYEFYSDTDIDQFIREHFDATVLKVFREYPLGVMRADFWRYAILYIHGGIYADIDAECLIPIEQWVDNKAEIVIALENDHHFCQWCIAATAAHPILANVIDLMCERWSQKEHLLDKHFVHYYTGPGVWTEAIAKHLHLNGARASEIYNANLNLNSKINLLDEYALQKKYVKHHFGSQFWSSDTQYCSWTINSDKFHVWVNKVPKLANGWTLNSKFELQNLNQTNTLAQFSCNDSAKLVLSLCNGSRSVLQIINFIQQQLTDVPTQLWEEIKAVIEYLVNHRIIEID